MVGWETTLKSVVQKTKCWRDSADWVVSDERIDSRHFWSGPFRLRESVGERWKKQVGEGKPTQVID